MRRGAFIAAALVAVGGCGGAGVLDDSGVTSKGGKKTGLDVPGLEVIGQTQHTITLQLCAGDSGAAGGFSIQWMTCAAFDDGTTVLDPYGQVVVVNAPGEWPLDSGAGVDAGVLCKASFSGLAHDTSWNLLPDECREITIGELGDLIEEVGSSGGVSTTCDDELDCGTCYVFRAFAHNVPGSGGLGRSDFTETVEASTEDCGDGGGFDEYCTYSQGGFGGPGKPYRLLEARFDSLYPDGLVVGGAVNYVKFTTSLAVQDYIPYGSGDTDNQYTGAYTDPGSAYTGGKQLSSQAVTLHINVDLNAGASPPFGDLTLCHLTDSNFALDGSALTEAQADSLNGQSVADVLAAAEAYLGGGSLPYGLARGQLQALVELLNTQTFHECNVGSFAADHLCP